MKKMFLAILFAVGSFFSVNASQNMCTRTGGVESISITSGSDCNEIRVTLSNTNSYKVTVNMTVVVVDNDGNETIREKIVVIPANKEKSSSFRTKNIKGEIKCANISQSYVSQLNVEKCE